MRLYSEENDYKIFQGSMLDMLEVIPPNSIDSIVTDPPYELGFMAKSWDKSGIAFQKETWGKCFTVLKPGGYLLAFGGSRTFHRIACAIEDAGFEIRDTIMWLYGCGFPKSMNIGLAIDKRDGVDNTTGVIRNDGACNGKHFNLAEEKTMEKVFAERQAQNEWAGWGTQLKPAYEPIIVARKPVECSVVDNVLKYRVGGINIDECRVGEEHFVQEYQERKSKGIYGDKVLLPKEYYGRFPANVIHDGSEEATSGMPDTGGGTTMRFGSVRQKQENNCYKLGFTQKEFNDGQYAPDSYGDEGSASRYFYCAKASKKDRDEGLDAFEERTAGYRTNRKDGSAGINAYAGATANARNIHPTVKPIELMQYLVRLVSPKGAIILDCFMGSGSTGKAVMFENRERHADYKFVGIELTPEYLPICKSRIEYGKYKYEYDIKHEQAESMRETGVMQQSIFDIGDEL